MSHAKPAFVLTVLSKAEGVSVFPFLHTRACVFHIGSIPMYGFMPLSG